MTETETSGTRQERRRVARKEESRRLRFERRQAKDKVTGLFKRTRGHVQILAQAGDGMGNPQIAVGVKRGLLGHPRPHPMITITEDELVAALDSTKELAPVLTKIGIVVLSQLTGFSLAEGPDALVEHVARWAGVDVKGLREQAKKDAEMAARAVDTTATEVAVEPADPAKQGEP